MTTTKLNDFEGTASLHMSAISKLFELGCYSWADSFRFLLCAFSQVRSDHPNLSIFACQEAKKSGKNTKINFKIIWFSMEL
jgi:hypothetical protein